MIPAKTRLRAPQVRAEQKRLELLQAARRLLEIHDLDAIVIPDVAREAGVAKSSAYHHFPDMPSLYVELARIAVSRLQALLLEPMPRVGTWQDIVSIRLRRGTLFFNGSAADRKLLLGPQTSSDIRRLSRFSDLASGELLNRQFEEQFRLPTFENQARIFFLAVELGSVIISVSVVEDNHVTEFFEREAVRAINAYLGCYLPETLARR